MSSLMLPLSRRTNWLRLCFQSLLFSSFCLVAGAADAKKPADLPAGAASETLKNFSRQTGREIVFAAETVGSVQTNAVKGELTPREAIDALLAGTGLVATQDETQRNDYRDLLPSVNAIYDLKQDLRLRAGASQSLSRPNYDSLAARTVVTDNGLGSVSIQTGNPYLMPRESTNTDLSLEWYFSRASMVSAAVFRKNLRNEFLTVSSSETALINGVTTTTTTRSPRNLDRARIDGLELSLTATRLEFLPAVLAGFGLQTNLTLLNIDTSSIAMTDGTQRKLRFLTNPIRRVVRLARNAMPPARRRTAPSHWAHGIHGTDGKCRFRVFRVFRGQPCLGSWLRSPAAMRSLASRAG